MMEGSWNFLDKYGFHYGGDSHFRSLLPHEVLNMLKKIPEETRRKLAARGYTAQAGYVMKYLPVPPNCLYIPEFTDGQTIMSYDISIALLRKVLQKIEQIKKSRSGSPNFESHKVESSDLQLAIAQYMHLRGTTRGPQDNTKRFALTTDSAELSTKQWLEKMRTLFISKGSGFSSRSVITGDPYIGIDVVGLPSEVAKRITFEEQVTDININRLQEVVDKGLCLTYRDGHVTYAITVGSKGHTTLKVGQTISRRIVDGDVVFLNRPPSTHKHSLQAFYVYIHDDHTVKINPLICSPLGADFDGDCVHIYYPQSLAAKAEALELFSVEKQLTSSHSGNLNLQLVNDSLLALKHMSSRTMLTKESADQLAMFLSFSLPDPAVVKSIPCWTITQIVQSALPEQLNCQGDRHLVSNSTVIKLDLDKESVQASFSDLVSSILSVKGPREALQFLNVLQPLLMEFLLLDGFSISLQDFDTPKSLLEEIWKSIQKQSLILEQSRCSKSQFVEMRVENNLKSIKQQISDFVAKCSDLGLLIDPKSESSISKVVQQLGFVGLQLYREGKFYSSSLVEDCFENFMSKHPAGGDEHPPEAYGLVQSSFFHGLNPYEELVHAISSREVIVRSSRGLTEPGTLFKSLMAILRDVVICYDGTVRNICSNSIMQFKYMEDDVKDFPITITPGEPVGVLAATAISNPAYKAVLDSSQSNNTSWELMKEILLTKVGYKNDLKDRKVILFLNDCSCPKKFCKEKAAIAVQGCLRRVKLEDCATDFSIEYQKQIDLDAASEATSALVGHIHLDKTQLERINISTEDILQRCQEVSGRYGKKKGHLSHLFKKITFATCDCSFTQRPIDGKLSKVPCLQFSFSDDNNILSESVERAVNVIADAVCTVLLDTIIKGDPRIQEAKIIWVGSDATSWVKNTRKASKGEPAVEIVVEKDAALHNGDAWRTTMDACIPVLNLIDTRRSIPYGIQQVRELLGISCAFDQVVQRLSTTIRMVAKGVLKDHLVLVANSMTCTGNLNGFNSGGYKATFRALKVQVPFTESTLFTPMRCFEKAAEKCHSDSLGCVVSSCSWGKHAAIGTGSAFQILWNEKQLKSNKEYGDGLYDFLALVRSDQEKASYTFLDDVDYLIEENEVDNMCLSPEPDGARPTFEDNFEGQDIEKVSSWDNGVAVNSTWQQNSSAGHDSSNWGNWSPGAAAADTGAAKPAEQDNASWDMPATAENNSNDWGGWGTEKPKEKKDVFGELTKPSTLSDWGANHGPQCAVEPEKPTVQSSWDNTLLKETQLAESEPWGKQKSDGDHIWEKQPNVRNKQKTNVDQGSWGNITVSPSSNTWDSNWGKKRSATAKSDVWSGLGNGQASKEPTDTGKEMVEIDEHSDFRKESNPWNTRKSDGGQSSWEKSNAPQDSWGKEVGKKTKAQQDSWNSKAACHAKVQQDSWGNVATQDTKAQPDSWGNVAKQDTKAQPDSWGNVAAQDTKVQQDSWGNVATQDSAQQDSWGNVAASPSNNTWDAVPSSQANQDSDANQWNSGPSSKPGALDGWNSPAEDSSNADKWNETKDSGNRKQGWKSEGWGAKSGNWKGQRNNSGRPPRNLDERGPPRRRFELTPEEEKILVEIEPIMLSIKKIVRESCDGVRLSAEDEKYIKENVLEHHPEKQLKVSGEIDYIMVNKHHTFQESRCMYVVSSDGSNSDFSYLKCMENFVRKTYTEHGESFCKKFFKRSRREQTPTVDGMTTPGTPAETPQLTAVNSSETEQGAALETSLGTPALPVENPQETPQLD